MSSPALSVVIPAYRAAAFLPETLASVRAQSLTDWELIVVEDGTDDGTARLVEAFAREGPQPVRYIRHPENRGISATRNTAVATARAPFIAPLDSDDLWLPNHLADLVATAHRTGAGLVSASCQLFDHESGRDLNLRGPETPRAVTDPAWGIFTDSWIIQPSAVLIARDALLAVGGFRSEFDTVEDIDCWLSLIRAGTKVAWTGGVTCRYRKHAGALSRRVAEMARKKAAVLERHADWDGLPHGLGRRAASSAWLAAGRLYRRSDPALARQCFHNAIRLRPFWWLPHLFLLATAGRA